MPTPSKPGSRKTSSNIRSSAPDNGCPRWSRRSRQGTRRMSPGWAVQHALYRSQGHLLEVTDLVEKMQQVPGGLFPVSLKSRHA